MSPRQNKKWNKRSQELKNRQQENAQRRTEAETELAKVNTDKQKQLANIDKQYQKAKVEAIKLHEQQVAEIRADIKQQEQKTDGRVPATAKARTGRNNGRGAVTSFGGGMPSCHTDVGDRVEVYRGASKASSLSTTTTRKNSSTVRMNSRHRRNSSWKSSSN